jgi:membrane protein DedA with SNARE-associated domain
MDALIEQFAGDPIVLAILLFLAPFVLEEAAIVGGAAVAGAGELPAAVALASLFLGVVVSDWVLYAVGAGVGRSAWLRRQIEPKTLEAGRELLLRGLWTAGMLARLVPWLLLPVFVASGYLGVGFWRFAAVNALIATIYVNVFFWGAYGVNLAIFDLLDGWGWAVAGALVIAVVAGARIARRRLAPRDRDQG